MDRPTLGDINLTSDELKQQKDKLKKLLNDKAKPQLLAQWIIIDGKLVCQWLSR